METETSGRDPWDGILEWSLLDAGQEPLASVLVVDDSETVARLLEWELCMAGYQVELASDGKTALKAAKDRTPDVVLTDVIMPEMDGFEVVRRLRADPATAETCWRASRRSCSGRARRATSRRSRDCPVTHGCGPSSTAASNARSRSRCW